MSDASGPGSILQSWTDSTLPVGNNVCCTLQTFLANGTIPLVAGTTYWVEVLPGANTWGWWAQNSTGATGLHAYNLGAGWALESGAVDGAFEVQGAPVLNRQGGTTSSPVYLEGTGIGGVAGTIGGQGSEDYYSFYWAGGAFSATASITGASSTASYLFTDGLVGSSCSGGASQTLNSGDSFTSTLASANLAPGQYCIGIDANSANDPNFSLTFNTPVSGVPEPSGFVLLFTGLGMIVVLRAKRGRQHP